MDDLAEFLEGRKRCIVLELEFPAPGRNGYHLSLGAFPDRYAREKERKRRWRWRGDDRGRWMEERGRDGLISKFMY